MGFLDAAWPLSVGACGPPKTETLGALAGVSEGKPDATGLKSLPRAQCWRNALRAGNGARPAPGDQP